MKWKCLFDNKQLTILTLGMAGLMAGCCTRSTGGSYSSTYSSSAQEYSPPPAQSQEYTGNQVIPLYKEQANVGTRQVDAGTVRIRKIVKTETVNQPVTLHTESVVIDRQPAATGQTDTSQAFQNQEITIHLHGEEPVVQTQIVPNGQVVAQKRSDVQQTNIETQIRRETVAIDKGNAQNVVVSDNLRQDENENENQPMGGGGEVGGQASASVSGPITDVTTLTSCQDPNSLQGRQVQLNGVTVDRIANKTLVIKDNSGKQCYVHLNEPMSNIQPGTQVNITGTVGQPLAPTGNEPQNEQIPQGSVCVQATSVQPAQ